MFPLLFEDAIHWYITDKLLFLSSYSPLTLPCTKFHSGTYRLLFAWLFVSFDSSMVLKLSILAKMLCVPMLKTAVVLTVLFAPGCRVAIVVLYSCMSSAGLPLNISTRTFVASASPMLKTLAESVRDLPSSYRLVLKVMFADVIITSDRVTLM